MRKFTKILLVALMAVPFLYSCSTTYEQADKAALITVQKSLTPAGFYGILDNGERLYPGVMRVNYTPSNDLQRAIVYFSELDEPREGFTYNADVFNIAEITTKYITQVRDVAADTLDNGLEITNVWIGGGFLNVELKLDIDPYMTSNVAISLQDMVLDGPANIEEGLYPLTLGVRCYPESDSGNSTTINTMACFYIGSEYDLDNLGCSGYKISYINLNSLSGDEKMFKIVTPENNAQSSF